MRPKTPWRLLGKWLVLVVSISFWTVWGILGLGLRLDEFALLWTVTGGIIFVGLLLALYLVTGPLYRSDARCVTLGSEHLLIEEPDGEVTQIPFSDIRRILSSSVAMTLVLKSGRKRVLGFGFGGETGDRILDGFREYAERTGVELLEYESRGMTPKPVKNVEVWEGSQGSPERVSREASEAPSGAPSDADGPSTRPGESK